MELRDEYKKIYDNISALLNLPEDVVTVKEKEELTELKKAIEQDVFSIVVLGEFSRGKSSFVNALIGEKILPMDVLPETALIHTLSYSIAPSLEVIYKDGSVEKGQVSEEYLKRFSAQNGECNGNVQYVHLGYPSPLLEKDIMIFDTPGVSDMDDQRAEITYGFIPRADLVIFLLDASSPLKKTEREFLVKRVFPQGIRHIVFIANKFDNLDEEETDENEYLSNLKKRLQNAFKDNFGDNSLSEIVLFPLSAKRALSMDENASKESGLTVICEYINKVANIDRSNIKLTRFKWQYHRILKLIYNKVLSKKLISNADVKELEKAKERIERELDLKKCNQDRLESYMAKEQSIILKMTDKSLRYFSKRLEDDICEMIEAYKGEDFKEFVETRVAKRVQREIDNWIALYGPRVLQLIRKVEMQVSHDLSTDFNTKVFIESKQTEMQMQSMSMFDVSAKDVSNTDIKAGALAALGGIGLTLIAGSVVMPLISFAAMPFIRKSLLKKQLMVAKEEVLAQLPEKMNECMMELSKKIHNEIRNRCDNAIKNIMYSYDTLLQDYQNKINKELSVKAEQCLASTSVVENLDDILANLRKMKIR